MSGYGMDDTDLVYNQGRLIHGEGDDAFTLANNAITAIGDCGGVLCHPTMVSAVESFYTNHCKDAHSLMYSVQDCGSGISASSNIVVDAENEATHLHTQSATQSEEAHGVLNRSLIT